MPEIVDISTALEDFFPLGAPPLVVELIPGASGNHLRSREPTAVAIFRTIMWEVDPERARTQADFEAALRTKGRLGRYLR